ncbi:MAG: Brp/Blh family beta-carotene 15,15'-dioxygenase [Litorimonas sp.]
MVDRTTPTTGPSTGLRLAGPGLFKSLLHDRVTALFTGLALILIAFGLVFPTIVHSDGATLVALFAIALVGLPHGALDVHLAVRSRLPRREALLIYGAILGLGSVAWLTVPTALICLFLGLSVWHFSRDFVALGSVTALGVAASLLMSPVLAFPAETQAIFAMLMPDAQAARLVAGVGATWPLVLATAGLLVLRSVTHPALVLAAGLAITAGFFLPPIVAFALYFCAWHSAGHLRAVFTETRATRFSLGEAALYAALTLAVLAGLVATWSWMAFDAPMIRAVFGLLVILTLPHMAIVELWQRRLKG